MEDNKLQNQANSIQTVSQRPPNELLRVMQESSTNAGELPAIIKKRQNEISMSEAIEQPSRIAYLRNNNRAELEFLLLIMLENLSLQFNVKEGFDDDQIEDCYMTIIAEFSQISPEELLYVFRRAKSGHYGPVYNRLDTQTVCRWIREYMDGERMTYFQQTRIEKKPTTEEVDILSLYGAEMEFQKKHGKPSVIYNAEHAKREDLKKRLRNQLDVHYAKKKEQENSEKVPEK